MGTIVDSGLGWYLDEDYLLTQAGANLGGISPYVRTGLGWDIKSEYLIKEPTFLGSVFEINASFTREYLSSGSGFILAAWVESSNWTGPYITSTDPSMVKAYCDPFQHEPQPYMDTYNYAGFVWYTWHNYWMQHVPSYPLTITPAITVSNVGIWDDNTGPAVVFQNAGVVISGTAPPGTKYITKVKNGAGAFAIVSYPHNGETVYVGVGISSIGTPDSAATVAYDGVSGSYDTLIRENVTFTMFYTEQLTGNLINSVPVIELDTDISAVPIMYKTLLFRAVANAAQIHVGYVPADVDPYAPGGTSAPGGGTDTDFDTTGDTILDSPLPTFSFANSGFARIYNPDLSQLQRLASYLWTDTTFLQTIVNHAKQLLEDPIESIITLNRLPISVPNGEAEVVKVLFIPTNTSMPPVTNQFVDVDCGTLQIKHEYDSALDYNPYTDISLVLPFIGVVQLDPDEVMDKTLSLTYRVDVVSGMCVAKVAVDGCVLYQYSGNCAISMPFNSADFSNYISAMVTAAKSIAGIAAAGAAGAMAAAAEGTEAVKAIVAKATSGEPESTGPSLPKTSNKSTNVVKETFGKGGIGEGTLKAAKKGVANTVSAVVSSKRTIEHAGHFSGNSGFLGVRRPYAIVKRPRMCNPDEYGRFNGRPCMMYLYLGNLTGYTEIQEIHLTGILATNDELIEIENLLKSGVIL